ncbi:DUF3307 domain-containing protein [Celeribacter sp.]|uniref:DUF3307 domain-containing protein n=1 Tax=Celeribacter sp. TaxID=1890673 RepID=UPI003A92F5DD
MTSLLAALFLAHVLADYVFQSAWMVAQKSKSETLFLHFLIVLGTAMVTTGQLADPWIYLLALTHVIIDSIKAKVAEDGITAYAVDQAAHLATIGAIALLAPDLYATGLWASAPAWLAHAMLLVAGLIYTTRAGGFAVGKLMQRFGDSPFAPSSSDTDARHGASLPNGGFWIGVLERGLIFLLLIGHMPAGIGFLVAAKSVLRFEATQDAKKAEWVIIGTLASFGWAIAITIGVIALRDALPPLEIMRPTP